MFTHASEKKGIESASNKSTIWAVLQVLVWLIGVAILYCLFFYPSLGVDLFWNILIPVAPFLFVIALGVWRNICPLATTNLLPRRLGLSQRKKMGAMQSGLFNLIAVFALYIIVPLRHLIFNVDGVATGIMLIVLAFIGVVLGFIYEWKSAWCSGLCPIQPVEKMYGENVISAFPNAQCDQCQNCVMPCPDSTPHFYPGIAKPTIFHKWSGVLITGGLPGFIWGWFHVPDLRHSSLSISIVDFYALPMSGMLISLVLFLILNKLIPYSHQKKLVGVFAASSVSCYYWFRIPSLIGFGFFPADGRLIDLSNSIPAWLVTAITITSTIFFFYWLVYRPRRQKSWLIRPAL